MSVTVEIDGKTYSGSGVQTLRMNYRPHNGALSSRMALNTKSRSEAVSIHLGEHGYLYALWPYDTPARFATSYRTEFYGKPKQVEGEDTPKNRARTYMKYLDALSRPGNQLELYPSQNPKFPVLMTFEDISDPTTVRKFHVDGTRHIKEHHNSKAFEIFYGPGARVVSVVVENTSDPETSGVLNSILGDHFFEEWHREAHGRQPDGKCWDDGFAKRNALYCSMGKGRFFRQSLKHK